MGISVGGVKGGSAGSGGGVIPENLFFPEMDARDQYTTNNPQALQQGVVCAVATLENGTDPTYNYYQWDANIGSWFDVNLIYQGQRGRTGDTGETGAKIVSASFNADDIDFSLEDSSTVKLADAVPTLKGDKGDTGSDVQTQFSIEPDGPWVDYTAYLANPTNYFYWRFSTDNGNTWSPNGIRLQATVENLPNNFGWFDDGNNGLELRKGDDIYLTLTEDEITSKRFNVQNNLIKFGTSKSLYDAGENVLFKNEVTGVSFHPVWQLAGDNKWGASVRRPLTNYTRQNYITGGFKTANVSNSVPAQLTITSTYNSRSTAFYLNSVNSYSDCTMIMSQDGKVKVVIEGLDISVGENRIVYSDTKDSLPFVDTLAGQTLTISVRDSDSNLIEVRELTGETGVPWWAMDSTEFEDATVLDARSTGGSIAYDEGNEIFDVLKATNSQLGVVKAGTGLAVESDGTMYSTVAGSIVTAVADEAARLALPQIAQAYTCIQIDQELVFYLNANQDPSDTVNWIQGGSTSSSVSGFKGKGDSSPRTGVIEATQGDYTGDEITYTDEGTGVVRKMVVVDGQLYLEEI